MHFNRKIICADGFEMSVQAGSTHYSDPREDCAEKYISVEVGYPTDAEELFMPYAEDPNRPTDTVYGWVPSSIVTLVCVKHGGVVDGELPNGVAYLVP